MRLDLVGGQLIWTQSGYSWLQIVDLLLLAPYLSFTLDQQAIQRCSHGNGRNIRRKITRHACFKPLCMSAKITMANALAMKKWTIGEARNTFYPWWKGRDCKLTRQRLWIGKEWRRNSITIHYTWAAEHQEKKAVQRQRSSREAQSSFPLCNCGCSLSFRSREESGHDRWFNFSIWNDLQLSLYSFVKTCFLPSFQRMGCLILLNSSNGLLTGF